MTDTAKQAPLAGSKVKVEPETVKAIRRAFHRESKTIGAIAIDFKLSRATVSAVVNLKGRYKE